MPVDPQRYRDALSKLASGVTVVTTELHGELFGMTATSFSAVSLEPPLVAVCLERGSHTLDAVRASRSFATSVLAFDQVEVARLFSRPGHKPFDRIGFTGAPSGAALIQGAIAWADANVIQLIEAGDHHVAIGEVMWSDDAEGSPLIYFDRDYRVLIDLEQRHPRRR